MGHAEVLMFTVRRDIRAQIVLKIVTLRDKCPIDFVMCGQVNSRPTTRNCRWSSGLTKMLCRRLVRIEGLLNAHLLNGYADVQQRLVRAQSGRTTRHWHFGLSPQRQWARRSILESHADKGGIAMRRRSFAAMLALMQMMSGCFWDKHFDLAWEEEVQLHDGRVIVVKIKRTYERLQQGLTRYGGTMILRETTLTFDAGGSVGLKTQLLKGGFPLILDQQDGAWILVFSWASGWSHQLLGGQDWGEDQNGYGQHVARLEGQQFQQISICSLPTYMNQLNFLFPNNDVEQVARFNGTRIDLRKKAELLRLHPLLVGYARLEMPSPGSVNACPPRIEKE